MGKYNRYMGYLEMMSDAVPGAKFAKGVGQAAFGAAKNKLESLKEENPKAFNKAMKDAEGYKVDQTKPYKVNFPNSTNTFPKTPEPISNSEWDDDTTIDASMDIKKKPEGKAKGGSISIRADGCAQRGKTKVRMC